MKNEKFILINYTEQYKLDYIFNIQKFSTDMG